MASETKKNDCATKEISKVPSDIEKHQAIVKWLHRGAELKEHGHCIDNDKEISVNFDFSDPANSSCDFFKKNATTFICLICGLSVKTLEVKYLLKHLRTHGLNKMIPSLNHAEHFRAMYENPSKCAEDPDFILNFFEENNNNLTCLCCNQQMANFSYSDLLKHIQESHSSLFCGSRIYPTSVKYSESSKSERTVLSFIINQGLPLDTYLQNFSKSLNDRNQGKLDKAVEELKVFRQNVFRLKVRSRFTITIDMFQDCDSVYLTAAFHYFENEKRKNEVFIKKLYGTEMTAEAIFSSLKESMESHGYKESIITSIVYKQKFDETFKNINIKKYHCFYSLLSIFADDIMKLPHYSEALDRLFEFIHKLRNDNRLIQAFQLVQKGRAEKINIFYSRNSPWYEIMEFLRAIVFKRCNFNSITLFARRWNVKGWINEEQAKYMDELHQLLRKVFYIAEYVSKPDSVISCVVPSIVDILNFIKKNYMEISNDRVEELISLHSFHFDPVVHGRNGDHYHIAMFLDPRYAYLSTICDDSKWQSIVESVKHILLRNTKYEQPNAENENDETNLKKIISVQIEAYEKTVKTDRVTFPSSLLMPWWSKQMKLLPLLYVMAAEYFTAPMCTLNAESYFGKQGKLSRLVSGGSFEQMSSALEIYSRNELFKGPLYVDLRPKEVNSEEWWAAALESRFNQCEFPIKNKDYEGKFSSARNSLRSEPLRHASGNPAAIPAKIVLSANIAIARQHNKKSVETLKRKWTETENNSFDLESMLMRPPSPVSEKTTKGFSDESVVKKEIKTEEIDYSFEDSNLYIKQEEPNNS